MNKTFSSGFIVGVLASSGAASGAPEVEPRHAHVPRQQPERAHSRGFTAVKRREPERVRSFANRRRSK